MPKPARGEFSGIEPGDYTAVIYQIIDLGTQTTPSGRDIHKYFFNLDLVDIGQSRALSNFGIPNWLSPAKPPYVGMYELITAVAKVPITMEELKAFDFWTMINKTIVVTFENNEKGYPNVIAIKPAAVDAKTTRELLTFEIEEIGDIAKLDKLDNRAAEQLAKSKEWIDQAYKTEPAEQSAEPAEEIKLSDIPF